MSIANDRSWPLRCSMFCANTEKAGVFLRYQDKQNHYRLTVTNDAGVTLIKRSAGIESVLWPPPASGVDTLTIVEDFQTLLSDAGLFMPSGPQHKRYRFIISVTGANIRVDLNDQSILEIKDGAIAVGGVGLFYEAEAPFQVNHLSVVSKATVRLPAGRVLRIINTNIPDLQAFGPEVKLFANPLLEPLFINDAYSGRGFRILDQDGNLIHQRFFLIPPATPPASSDLLVVPSEDGTAALLLPSADGFIEDDRTYELGFSFSRKKTGLPTLTQWGSDENELVVISLNLNGGNSSASCNELCG